MNPNRFPLPCFQGACFYLEVVGFIFLFFFPSRAHINAFAGIDLIPRSGAYLSLVPLQGITFPLAISAARQKEERKELRRACGYM